ncbi:hypothetical protein AGLY_017337 [Aphis glycines]|uniref:Uncharacterized protein n=1 Tax=Aphis glycines TaxID=307491 RepID=A0A6G0SWD2_APHGL|nr:hypothetical protein AGLY_017337 [Aphis glycines]
MFMLLHNFFLLAFEVQILTKIRQNHKYLQIIFYKKTNKHLKIYLHQTIVITLAVARDFIRVNLIIFLDKWTIQHKQNFSNRTSSSCRNHHKKPKKPLQLYNVYHKNYMNVNFVVHGFECKQKRLLLLCKLHIPYSFDYKIKTRKKEMFPVQVWVVLSIIVIFNQAAILNLKDFTKDFTQAASMTTSESNDTSKTTTTSFPTTTHSKVTSKAIQISTVITANSKITPENTLTSSFKDTNYSINIENESSMPVMKSSWFKLIFKAVDAVSNFFGASHKKYANAIKSQPC